MAAKLATVEPRPPARSPERERLAAAVAALREAEGTLQRVEDAKRKLPDTIDCIQNADRAKADLDDAMKGHARYLVDRLLGETTESDPVVAGQEALRAAEKALQDAKSQHTILDQRIEEINRRIDFCRSGLRSTVSEVLKADPAVSRVAEELERLEARCVKLRKILSAVSQRNGIPDQHRFWNAMRPHLIPADASMVDLVAWQRALAALETGDADVALPELPVTNEHVSTDTPPPRSAA